MGRPITGEYEKDPTLQGDVHLQLEKNAEKNTKLVGGWATPLKNMKVNWED